MQPQAREHHAGLHQLLVEEAPIAASSCSVGITPASVSGVALTITITRIRRLLQVGQADALRQIAIGLLAHGHLLMEDVPGVGKTLLARAVARAMDLDFGRIQGTPDLLPSDITGSSVLENGAFRFVPGPVFTNVLLVDEINRATPRAQSALLEAMQERQVSVDGVTRPLPDPFLVLGDAEPDRAGGYLRAAGGAARPVPAAHQAGLPRRGAGAGHRGPLRRGRRAP